MRKLSTLVLLAFLAAPAFCAPVAIAAQPLSHVTPSGDVWLAKTSNSALAAPAFRPALVEFVEVCYFGVTLRVTTKIAQRLIKVGATMGACQGSQECPPGFVFIDFGEEEGGCIQIGASASVEKPVDLQRTIQLAPVQAEQVTVSFQDVELSVEPKTAARLIQRGFAAGPAQPQADEAVAGR